MSSGPTQGGNSEDAQLELAIGRILHFGIVVSSVCLGLGLVMTFVRLDNGLAHLLLKIGLFTLMATPAARVVVSVVDYVMQRDWLFVILTLTVLSELVMSLVAASYGARL